MHNESWDVVIVGGGSAGLSAALMLGRSRRRVLVLDGGRPRNSVAPHMHGVLGRDGWSPLELLKTGRAEVERYGVVIRSAEVSAAALSEGGFTVTLTTGEQHFARRMLLATGLRDLLPDIPGLAEQWGTGVAHCPYCDGWEVRDQRIGVIATGPMSVHQAQLVRQLSPHVTYFRNGTELPDDARRGLAARGIAVDDRPVIRLVVDSHELRAIELSDGESTCIDSVFVRPPSLAIDELASGLGAQTSEAFDGGQWLSVDVTGRTSTAGLWAAGNVVNPGATVPVASAAGTMAGGAINADLVNEEIAMALAEETEDRRG
jgi:thioredoxin reductase